MLIFQFKEGAALEFFRRAKERNANTLTERQAILLEMVREGLIERVVETKRTKEQVIQDMAKHYKVLHIKAKGENDESLPPSSGNLPNI